jgi:Dolichyl-phosphate-mannose-protein mannosyltransferase
VSAIYAANANNDSICPTRGAYEHLFGLNPWVWSIIGLLLFLPGIGGYELFDWDEINFAESAREMLISGDYGRVTIDFAPFWEKPPLFIWLQALSMKLFGVNEFASRLPNALTGAATLALLSHWGRIHSQAMGFFWPLLYAGSLLSFFYFKSGIIDPLFNTTRRMLTRNPYAEAPFQASSWALQSLPKAQ